MGAFTDAELEYLGSQPLMRFATASPSGRPDVAPVGFSVDPDTRVFSFQFRINLAIAAPTEIFVPAVVHYTIGYSVALTPAGAAQWSAQPNNRIWIEPTDATAPDQLISVRITPAL